MAECLPFRMSCKSFENFIEVEELPPYYSYRNVINFIVPQIIQIVFLYVMYLIVFMLQSTFIKKWKWVRAQSFLYAQYQSSVSQSQQSDISCNSDITENSLTYFVLTWHTILCINSQTIRNCYFTYYYIHVEWNSATEILFKKQIHTLCPTLRATNSKV
jgi:hypothetical protein